MAGLNQIKHLIFVSYIVELYSIPDNFNGNMYQLFGNSYIRLAISLKMFDDKKNTAFDKISSMLIFLL